MSPRVEQSLSQLLHEALVSLRTLGKRSILALLGIVIGSSSVVALINIGHNAAVDAAMIFKDMGTDTLVVQFPPKGNSNVPMRTRLDLDAVRQAVPGLPISARSPCSAGLSCFMVAAPTPMWSASHRTSKTPCAWWCRTGVSCRASMPTKPTP
jgi:hypothetical protein